MRNPDVYDLIIIGAGPAGLTAAIYAGRYRLKVLVLEKIGCGGQIVLSETIENYPGFPGGILTHELIYKFKKQVDELGVGIVSEEVFEITQSQQLKEPVYSIKTNDNSYETRSVIIASGAQPKRLDVKGEERLTGRGVSYCGTCDGPLFKNKEIVVVGGGDRAIEEALFLTSYASKVTVIHRRDKLRASEILEERARNNPKINFVLDAVVDEIIGKDRVEAINVRNVKTGVGINIICQGVFIFVGIFPNTGFLKNQLQLDELGFVVTDEEMKTLKQGIFACGDCRKKSLYQVVNACGEAAVAAYSAERYLL
ncbi:MAG: thioredoxin-disulfide reductase [Candidatus Omnitrophica bacterium]|nr:thioredoxin-disulfide reductase [Candidatus Omnitrophota bacterium]